MSASYLVILVCLTRESIVLWGRGIKESVRNEADPCLPKFVKSPLEGN